MDMNQAAVFLAGSILTMLGFVVVVIGIVIINNLLHRYWKPVKFLRFDHYPPHRFATEEEIQAVSPRVEPDLPETVKSKK